MFFGVFEAAIFPLFTGAARARNHSGVLHRLWRSRAPLRRHDRQRHDRLYVHCGTRRNACSPFFCEAVDLLKHARDEQCLHLFIHIRSLFAILHQRIALSVMRANLPSRANTPCFPNVQPKACRVSVEQLWRAMVSSASRPISACFFSSMASASSLPSASSIKSASTSSSLPTNTARRFA